MRALTSAGAYAGTDVCWSDTCTSDERGNPRSRAFPPEKPCRTPVGISTGTIPLPRLSARSSPYDLPAMVTITSAPGRVRTRASPEPHIGIARTPYTARLPLCPSAATIATCGQVCGGATSSSCQCPGSTSSSCAIAPWLVVTRTAVRSAGPRSSIDTRASVPSRMFGVAGVNSSSPAPSGSVPATSAMANPRAASTTVRSLEVDLQFVDLRRRRRPGQAAFHLFLAGAPVHLSGDDPDRVEPRPVGDCAAEAAVAGKRNALSVDGHLGPVRRHSGDLCTLPLSAKRCQLEENLRRNRLRRGGRMARERGGPLPGADRHLDLRGLEVHRARLRRHRQCLPIGEHAEGRAARLGH